MRGAISRRLTLAALTLSAAAFSSLASAEYSGPDRVKAYGNYGAWRISQHFTSEQIWCSAQADYQGGERLALIASEEDWALRISHPEWRGVAAGKGYELDMRTDSGWSVGYRAWGYRSGDDGYSGLTMHTFPRALDHLAQAHSVYFVDLSGAVISALDLTGSAKAISSLRACRNDLATAAAFDAPPTSALVTPEEVETPAAPEPIQLEAAPSEAEEVFTATEMEAYAALNGSDLTPARMKPLEQDLAPDLEEGGGAPFGEAEASSPEDILPDEEDLTPADIEAALEDAVFPAGEQADFPEADGVVRDEDITPADAEAALTDGETPIAAEPAQLGAAQDNSVDENGASLQDQPLSEEEKAALLGLAPPSEASPGDEESNEP